MDKKSENRVLMYASVLLHLHPCGKVVNQQKVNDCTDQVTEFITMADVHSRETRSFNMSRIRGKNTKPELLVRKFLFAQGLRFTLHNSKLSGKPDIVLPRFRKIVFINGCFWHGHTNCKYFVLPKTRPEWWADKITTNKKKDKENIGLLRKQGWDVIIVWECQLRKKRIERTLMNLLNTIKYNQYN